MKDIGEKFRETRELIGVSREEAASDMDVTLAQLENLEDGNANAFKDIFFLKDLIRKYAKYLNLNEDELISEFNEFMFNFTSKIPVAEIEKKVSEIKKEEIKESSKRVASPYTIMDDKKSRKSNRLIYIIITIGIIILLVIIFLLIKTKIDNNNFVGLNILKGVYYESSK